MPKTLVISTQPSQNNIAPDNVTISSTNGVQGIKNNGISLQKSNWTAKSSYANMVLRSWTSGGSQPINAKSITWCPQQKVFFAVSNTGVSIRGFKSTDGGVSFTPITMPLRPISVFGSSPYQWNSVTWSPELSRYCAVADSTSLGYGEFDYHNIAYSSDATSWSKGTITTGATFQAIIWSSQLSRFVAAGSRIAYSNNGVSWTTASYVPAASIYALAWSPELGLLCAVGSGSLCHRSTNGVDWVQGSGLSSTNWVSIAWSSQLGLFCAVSPNGTIATSSDAQSWSNLIPLGSRSWVSIVWVPEFSVFCAVSLGGETAASPDGVNWTLRDAISGNWTSIAWAPELTSFCAVSSSGPTMINV